jgi:uncharacterized protein DUF3105
VTTRTERWAWRAGVLALLAAAVAATVTGPGRFLIGSVTGSPATDRASPCLPGEAVPIMDSPHVSAEEIGTVDYNSLPPTSGPHFGFTIATGIYRGRLPEGLTVHAMEHGHVVIQYAPDTPPETVEQLERLGRRYARDVILAPYPELAHGVALTAWGRIETLAAYDERRVTEFVEGLRGRYHHGWSRPDDCPG